MIFIPSRNSMYAIYKEGYAETILITPEDFIFVCFFSMIFGNLTLSHPAGFKLYNPPCPAILRVQKKN
jgi:hypothetical protein